MTIDIREYKETHHHFCPGLQCGNAIDCMISPCELGEMESGPRLCSVCVEEENVFEGDRS